jgi:hypothetical protein
MREMIIISAEELDEIKGEADRLRRKMRDLFTADEVEAIREEQERRVRDALNAREELEWQLRFELARVREAEGSPIKLGQAVKQLLTSLEALVSTGETSIAPFPPPIRRVA